MYKFRNATPSNAARCFEIETSAYEGDEAATLKKISKRIAEYPQGFLILEIDNKVIGFINSGCAYEVAMSDEDFKELVGHAPEAPNVVILSVVVDPAYQGKGHSKALMREFVKRMAGMDKKTIHLMCKEHHVPFMKSLAIDTLNPQYPTTEGCSGMKWSWRFKIYTRLD